MTDVLSDVENTLKDRLDTEAIGGCVTTYEKVEQVVHDTVYRHQCSEHHVSRCNVTHVTRFKDGSETRCIPGRAESASILDKGKNDFVHPLLDT